MVAYQQQIKTTVKKKGIGGFEVDNNFFLLKFSFFTIKANPFGKSAFGDDPFGGANAFGGSDIDPFATDVRFSVLAQFRNFFF